MNNELAPHTQTNTTLHSYAPSSAPYASSHAVSDASTQFSHTHENATTLPSSSELSRDPYDYVSRISTIAVYDNLRSAPRTIQIQPAQTQDYIAALASQTYLSAKELGGSIPFTVIQEVSENFIHAQFSEVVISILDKGNTIRFADQGPGISDVAKAQLPGFSSATSSMKRFIRGVGSGLPIVKEYFESEHGSVVIESNINAGAVVTISLTSEENQDETALRRALNITNTPQNSAPTLQIPILTEREITFLHVFLVEGALGITEMAQYTDAAPSTVHATFQKLLDLNLIEQPKGTKKRVLTAYGTQVAHHFDAAKE